MPSSDKICINIIDMTQFPGNTLSIVGLIITTNILPQNK